MSPGAPDRRAAVPRYDTVRLCSGKGSYEAVPNPAATLDLARARRMLEGRGIRVIDARVMLIAETAPQVTLSRNGRILIKTRDEREAQATLDRLLSDLGLPARTKTLA